jgi:hypothetical protein
MLCSENHFPNILAFFPLLAIEGRIDFPLWGFWGSLWGYSFPLSASHESKPA